ncbi:TPA: adenylate cyclase [Salmonella enterica]|nr:adenylate cyclase [Salmonella enterica subsp. enterica serovar Bredeney]HAK8485176.1 adenylate cyclase [Salmonella enterica]HAK8655349.1 adenylate cyclase [Salmonella enterica]
MTATRPTCDWAGATGVRRGRSPANLGAAIICNAFLDYDLSWDHARWGLGSEYWRDDFKLNANAYLRLTNWKDSPDLENYDERLADGWDVRAEAKLPSYSQLGAKLAYEQYYGHDVGLFGYDHLQKDPHAITAGLTWTPVPLLSFSAEQRQGKQGENDTRFGLNVTLNPDLTWQQQIDPPAVAGMRSLGGVLTPDGNVVDVKTTRAPRKSAGQLPGGY